MSPNEFGATHLGEEQAEVLGKVIGNERRQQPERQMRNETNSPAQKEQAKVGPQRLPMRLSILHFAHMAMSYVQNQEEAKRRTLGMQNSCSGFARSRRMTKM